MRWFFWNPVQNTYQTAKRQNGMCFDKNMDFSTAEYYDERIGRVRIDIGVDYSGRDSKLAKHNFEAVIEELIDKQFQLYLKSHKEEYIKTLIVKQEIDKTNQK